ncbi:hypothetical protein E3P94_01160 [Wallemia ichthyophaga]|nr:hypothetical protein E3P95_01028 [Wallemia ichthyophaga]TIB03170.1 hypothetical protein E3P94_01160 [Wallemia ichthyophaga]
MATANNADVIELQSWVEALEKYDAGDYIHALRQFSTMQSRGQSSKIEFNRAVIHASLGDQKGATELYNSSLRIDPYFAIAHFQSGVCNFMRGRYEHARNDYEASQAQLRGNPHIDYNQLGLAYKLESANINFNIALTFYYSGRPDDGISHIQLARNGASLDQNSVIDDCLRDEAKGYMPYSVQPGVVFRPSDSQIKNLEKKDFIGQAKVVYTDDDGTSPDIPLTQSNNDNKDDVPLTRRLPGGGGTLKRNPTHWQPKLLRRPTLGSRKQSSAETTPVSSGATTPVNEKGGFFGLVRQKTERRKAPTEEMRTKAGLTPDEAATGPKQAAMLSRARTLGSATLAEKRSKSEQDVPSQANQQSLTAAATATTADTHPNKGYTLTDNGNSDTPFASDTDESRTPSRAPSPPPYNHTPQPHQPSNLHHSPSQPQLAPSRARFPTRKTSLRYVSSKFTKNGSSNIPRQEIRRSRSFNEGDDFSLAYNVSDGSEMQATKATQSNQAPTRSNTLLSKLSGRSGVNDSNMNMNHEHRKGKPPAINTLSNVPAGWPRSADTSPLSLFQQTQSHRAPQIPALSIGDALMQAAEQKEEQTADDVVEKPDQTIEKTSQIEESEELEQTPKPTENIELTVTPSTPSQMPDKDFSIKFDERTDTMYDTQNDTSVPSSVSDNSMNNPSNDSGDNNERGSPVDALTTLSGGSPSTQGATGVHSAANAGPFKQPAPLQVQEKPALSRQASALRRRGTYGKVQEQQQQQHQTQPKQGIAIDVSDKMRKMGIEEGNEENDGGFDSAMIKGMSPVEQSSLNAERLLEKGVRVTPGSLHAQTVLESLQGVNGAPILTSMQPVQEAHGIPSPTPPPASTPPNAASAPPPRSPESKSSRSNGSSPQLKVRFKIHYGDDVRGMLVSNETSYDAFLNHILRKFDKSAGSFRVRFKDEDGVKITVQDHSDLELAIDTARLHGNGRSDGKLDICRSDVATFEGRYRDELTIWSRALEAYDREDVAQAVKSFKTIAHTSKIQFNLGMIYDALVMSTEALKCFNRASELDQYLAVSHFQAGVSYFKQNEFNAAIHSFSLCLECLRDNITITYTQLGLKYSLHYAEVQFNLGLCLIAAGRRDHGLNKLRLALIKSEKPEHAVISKVLNNGGIATSLFAVPIGTLFQPPEDKIKNMDVKDYLGRSQLISTSHSYDLSTDFAGVKLVDHKESISNRIGNLERSKTAPSAKTESTSIPILRSKTSFRANLESSIYPKSAVFTEDILTDETTDRTSISESISNPTQSHILGRAYSEDNNHFQNHNSEMYFTRRQFEQPAAELETNMLNGQVSDLHIALDMKRSSPILTLPLHKSRSPPLPTPSTSASSEDSERSFKNAMDEKLNLKPKSTRPTFINRSFGTLRTKSSNLINTKRSSTSIPKGWPSTSENGTGTPMAVSPIGPISSPLPGSFVSTGPGTARGTPSESDTPTSTFLEYKRSVPSFNIRIKIFLNEDVRGMILSAYETSYEKFRSNVHAKFPHIEADRLAIRFKDENDLVTILDESDWEMAIECARVEAEMRERSYGSLEVHCAQRTKEYSFFGPIGTGAITILTPVITYLLYYACPNSYDDGTCKLLQKPALGRLAGSDFWYSLFTLEAFAVYLAWYAFTVFAWAIIPAQWVRGTQLRDGSYKYYKMNALATLLMATGLAAGQILRAGPEGFTYFADNWIPLLTASLVMSIAQSVFCYVSSFTQGKLLALGGNTGNCVHDFFIGRELNPSIGSFDIKTFNELRPGLILWWILDISLACRQLATFGQLTDSMILVVAFHGWYVFDALYNESIILTQMDIVHDGFGYMLAFGDLTWVPFTYSLQARFLAYHPNILGPSGSAAIAALQLLGYYIFRTSNAEKNEFRNGKNPKNLQYMQTKRGTKLLTTGWWGTLRHPNYLGDLIMALAWSLPTGSLTPLTYFYPAYFTVLLIHRALRDDAHCREKYGDDWNAYVEKVPYCIFPKMTKATQVTSLLVKKLCPQAQLPARGSADAAGYDLFSVEKKVIGAGDKALIDLGISISVPAGTYGRVAPRSGLAAKHHIHTGAGVIDADYRGRVFVLLFNLSQKDFEINQGDRVAQLILEKIETFPVEEVEELSETVRGAGGFGSTGGYGEDNAQEKAQG